ncbi:MAG: tetratricopeptide repeat protein [Blastocatellia bacterium]|nr:tetratricopeptide repeat protein [Blastocatellia bacterium]
MSEGEYDRAIADFDEAIRLNPKSADVYNSRGLAFADKAIMTARSPNMTRRSGSLRKLRDTTATAA